MSRMRAIPTAHFPARPRPYPGSVQAWALLCVPLEGGVRISIGVGLLAGVVIVVSCAVRHGTDAAPPVPTPDAGSPPSVDAGTPPDAGVDAGADAGPWPNEAAADYSQRFGVGTPQSVGIDEGLNLWFLDGDRIGVLRPGDSTVRWTRGIGQARQAFGVDSLAMGSTVICGGGAGRAYVGYWAHEMERADGI